VTSWCVPSSEKSTDQHEHDLASFWTMMNIIDSAYSVCVSCMYVHDVYQTTDGTVVGFFMCMTTNSGTEYDVYHTNQWIDAP
jgi:hypothetical protein